MPLTRALTALRTASTGPGTVTVRRWHLRALIEAYDRATLRREPAEPLRIEEDCAPMVETMRLVPRDAFEALSDAVGAGMRRA